MASEERSRSTDRWCWSRMQLASILEQRRFTSRCHRIVMSSLGASGAHRATEARRICCPLLGLQFGSGSLTPSPNLKRRIHRGTLAELQQAAWFLCLKDDRSRKHFAGDLRPRSKCKPHHHLLIRWCDIAETEGRSRLAPHPCLSSLSEERQDKTNLKSQELRRQRILAVL